MYGLAGERRLTEWTLPGCRATKAPRRCGSATPPEQFQLDIFGELADVLFLGLER
jgi:hypothetical protein